MVDLEELKAKSDIVVSWLSLIGVGAAVVFGINEYQQNTSNRIDDAHRTTLEFISRYNQDSLVQARSSVQRTFDTLGAQVAERLVTVTDLDAVNAVAERHYCEQASAQLSSAQVR